MSKDEALRLALGSLLLNLQLVEDFGSKEDLNRHHKAILACEDTIGDIDMNEHIKELALLSGFKIDTNVSFAEKTRLKCFAELIVKECAQEAYDCGKQFRNDEHYRADNLWPHFERVCNAVGDDIKIKFGVK